VEQQVESPSPKDAASVYEIVAVSPTAGEIRLTTADPDTALEQCRKEAMVLIDAA
jgi:hypothetical protein